MYCQAIVSTILKYRKLKAAKLKEHGKRACSEFSDDCDYHMLLEAWKPISMGYKRRYFLVGPKPTNLTYENSISDEIYFF